MLTQKKRLCELGRSRAGFGSEPTDSEYFLGDNNSLCFGAGRWGAYIHFFSCGSKSCSVFCCSWTKK